MSGKGREGECEWEGGRRESVSGEGERESVNGREGEGGEGECECEGGRWERERECWSTAHAQV